MKFLTMAVAISLALAAGCERKPMTPPSPKTDSSSPIPQAAAGSSTTRANLGAPTTAEKKDFQQRGDGAGPQSSDTKPTMKN
ncbi:MAG TPA: hypothetical protein VGJ74_03605 [Burkholderiales bacterium]|jgi:hypothetical protein